MIEHHALALGWTLIHVGWEATLAGAAVLLADALLRGPQLRSVVRFLALGALALGAAITCGLEETRTLDITLLPPERYLQPGLATHIADLVRASAPLAARVDATRVLEVLDALWLIGVAALVVRAIGGWRALQRLANESTPHRALAADGAPVRVHPSAAGPLAFGVVRPVVILPASALRTLTDDELGAILAHEAAHVRRADAGWNLVQTVFESLLFFHPVVRWLGRGIRELRELSCDDAVVANGCGRVQYATALLRLEERRGSDARLALAWNGHQPSLTFRRIARVLGEPPRERYGRRIGTVALTLVLTTAFVAALYLHAFEAALALTPVRPG